MNDPIADDFRSCVLDAVPELKRAFVYEYRIHTRNGSAYDLVPTDKELGLPDLPDVKVKPGIPGLSSVMVEGALVYIKFANGKTNKPIIVSVSGPDDDGFTPTSITLSAASSITVGDSSTDVNAGGGFAEVVRKGEKVGFTGPFVDGDSFASAAAAGTLILVLGSGVTTPGAPPLGKSRLKA